MIINKIQKQNNNKYKIIIDDETFITYDDVILENNLLYKKNIDNDLYNKIKEDTKYYDIYNKVVKYIMKKRRSEKEVRLYINKYISDIDKIEKMIIQLKKINLINDIQYCSCYINDSIYLGKNGINKIKNDLINQNIPLDVIEEQLDKIDYDIINNRLEKMILKKIKSNKKYSNYELKQKVLNDMMNLGYDKEEILTILNNNIIDDTNILENEYRKLYNKLSNKYSGEKLNIIIKQKLSLKGFDSSSIDDIANKKAEF